MSQSAEVETAIVRSTPKDLSVWMQSDKNPDKLAILLPGFMDSGDYPHLQDLSVRLSQAGYVCVRFDPPGTWTNGEDINDYNLTNYAQAVIDIHNWAKQKFDIKQCVLIGHSFGGVAATVAATKLKDVTAMIAIMSPTYLTAAVKWPKNKPRKGIRQEPGELTKTNEFEVPYSFAEDVNSYNVPVLAASLDCPILYIAGSLDETVLPEEVKELAHKTKQGQYLLLQGIRHGYWRAPTEVAALHTALMGYLREKQLA